MTYKIKQREKNQLITDKNDWLYWPTEPWTNLKLLQEQEFMRKMENEQNNFIN